MSVGPHYIYCALATSKENGQSRGIEDDAERLGGIQEKIGITQNNNDIFVLRFNVAYAA